MKIAVNAKPLCHKPMGGIKRYLEETLVHMPKESAELTLYALNPLESPCISALDPKVISSHAKSKLGKFLWTFYTLPKQLKKSEAEVFWGPCHSLPHKLPPHMASVVTVHDLVWLHAKQSMTFSNWLLNRIFMPKAIKKAELVLTISHATAKDIAEKFPEHAHKVRVVHCGAKIKSPPEDRSVVQALGITKPYFIFVGTLEPRKNLARLIEAFSKLPQELLNSTQFVIAGGKGWGGIDIPTLVCKFNLEQSVVLLDHPNDILLTTLIKHAQFLAMPSLYEGFGLPIAEAHTLGTPVLTSNLSSLPEVAGNAGHLVDPCCIKSISAGLHHLLTDKDYLNQLAKASKENAERFKWEKAALETQRVLEEAIKIKRSINILHVYKKALPESTGGAEQFIDQLALATQHAATVRVFCLSKNAEKNPIRYHGYEVHQAKASVELFSTPLSLSAIKKFRALAKKADIIHYHYPWPLMDILHFLKGVKKPSVVTYQSDIVKQKKLLFFYTPLMKLFLHSVTRIIATSPHYLASSKVLQRYKEKVTTIPLALNKNTYPKPSEALKAAWRKKLGDQFFLFIGVLRYYKGLPILLEAAVHAPFPLVILGAGPLEKSLKDYAEKHRLTHVTFLGAVDEIDKVALLELCYAVILPSHLRSEAFGIALLEGAMYGKPMLSAEIGTGTSFVNAHQETGLVVPPNDPRALGAAMRHLWEHPVEAEKMGQNAMKRYHELFSAEKLGERYTQLYAEIS